MVKYGILSTNRHSKLHAVVDCLFFTKIIYLCIEYSVNNYNFKKAKFKFKQT